MVVSDDLDVKSLPVSEFHAVSYLGSSLHKFLLNIPSNTTNTKEMSTALCL